MAKSADLIQGTLDLLVLKTLAREPIHGWGIAKRIEQLSDDVLSVGQGSLYPALHRLEQQGWISAEWKDSELGRSWPEREILLAYARRQETTGKRTEELIEQLARRYRRKERS